MTLYHGAVEEIPPFCLDATTGPSARPPALIDADYRVIAARPAALRLPALYTG